MKSRYLSNEKVGPTSKLGKKKQYEKYSNKVNLLSLLFFTANP
jgi:hypothetical protein